MQGCRQQGLKLRSAESCTAGAVAACIASVAGASDVLDRGWVTYSNQAKIDELGVAEALFIEHGAVSEAVVKAMACGGVDDSSLCIAISGIAGPGGGTAAKPVGTVWMAVALAGKSCLTKKFSFQGDRTQVQSQAVEAAIHFLLVMLNSTDNLNSGHSVTSPLISHTLQ